MRIHNQRLNGTAYRRPLGAAFGHTRMRNTLFTIMAILVAGCTHPIPEGSYSVRCSPVFRNIPQRENGDFVQIPSLHLIGINTDILVYESVADLYPILNTNEVYDFTVSRYERTDQYYGILDKPINVKHKGLKIIMVEYHGHVIYKDFKDIPTK